MKTFFFFFFFLISDFGRKITLNFGEDIRIFEVLCFKFPPHQNFLDPPLLTTEIVSPYFTQEKDIVFCNNAEGVLKKLSVTQYDPNDWRFFIDSCKRSLKCVLLHNGNDFGSIPLGQSTTLKEKYSNIKFVLEKIGYYKHNWIICVDLKMVGFLLGLQGGYTKFPCFICLWDSLAREQHWNREQRPHCLGLFFCWAAR